MLQRIGNRLLPRNLPESPDGLRQANRVIAMMLAIVIWVPVFGMIFLVVGAPITSFVLFGVGLGLLGTLWLLRRGCSPSLCGNLLSAITWLACTLAAMANGGLNAPGIAWYVIVPVSSLWLCGPRWGTVWTCASVLAICGQGIASWLGVVFPDESPAPYHQFLEGACLIGVVCCVFLLVRVVTKMEHDARELLREANRRLELLAASDGLTGIANRRTFDSSLEQEWLRHERMRLPLSMVIVDVDCFKQFNDMAGHLAGDDCLRSIAQAIQAQSRRPGDLAARCGGDEFGVVLPNTDERGADLVAEGIRLHVKALAIPHPGSVVCPQVTVSVGTTTAIPGSDSSPLDFYADADEALYLAKTRGRDCTAHFASARPKLLQFVG